MQFMKQILARKNKFKQTNKLTLERGVYRKSKNKKPMFLNQVRIHSYNLKPLQCVLFYKENPQNQTQMSRKLTKKESLN
jgi:hypothetical protein